MCCILVSQLFVLYKTYDYYHSMSSNFGRDDIYWAHGEAWLLLTLILSNIGYLCYFLNTQIIMTEYMESIKVERAKHWNKYLTLEYLTKRLTCFKKIIWIFWSKFSITFITVSDTFHLKIFYYKLVKVDKEFLCIKLYI